MKTVISFKVAAITDRGNGPEVVITGLSERQYLEPLFIKPGEVVEISVSSPDGFEVKVAPNDN